MHVTVTPGSGLGIAPLLIAGAAGASAAAGAGAYSSWSDGYLGTIAQWLGVKPTPDISAPPALRAPAAPQTQWGMLHWSPDVAGEAAAQRAIGWQQGQDAGVWGPDAPQGGEGYGLGMLVAVGVGLFLIGKAVSK